VSNSDYDRAYKLASQNRVSVPEVFRRAFHRLCATGHQATMMTNDGRVAR
jgi:hypothetical protein